MVAPTRFPAGLATYRKQDVLANFPAVSSQNQQGITVQEMYPYTADTFTVTNTTATIGGGVYNAAGAALVAGYNGGCVSMAVTTAVGGKAGLALNGNAAANLPFQLIPGNQAWFESQIALNKSLIGFYPTGTGTLTAGDATANIRIGLMDVSDPTGTITNGIYFEIPGTKNTVASAANLVIKNTGLTGATVTTTIKNVVDLARPSGIFGDTTSFSGDPAAALTTTGAANKYTSIAVANAGAGYAVAPLVRTTGAGAASPFAQAYVQIGGGTGQTQAGNMVGSPLGAGLYAPYLTHVGGAGYTTFTTEVNAWISLQLYYNGKGVLFVGVNNRLVATIGVATNGMPNGVAQALAAGATVDNSVGNQYIPSNASMTSSIAPVTPASNTFDVIMPMVPMTAAVGYSLNTAATNILFIDSLSYGAEYN